MSTTYSPDSRTKYFIQHTQVETWLQEQYDVPHFNVPSDLEESASPGGSYGVKVDGKISDYNQNGLDEFFEGVEEQKERHEKTSDAIPYIAPDTRHMTGPLLNKLAQDGHIPEGDYVIEMEF